MKLDDPEKEEKDEKGKRNRRRRKSSRSRSKLPGVNNDSEDDKKDELIEEILKPKRTHSKYICSRLNLLLKFTDTQIICTFYLNNIQNIMNY